LQGKLLLLKSMSGSQGASHVISVFVTIQPLCDDETSEETPRGIAGRNLCFALRSGGCVVRLLSVALTQKAADNHERLVNEQVSKPLLACD